MIRWLTGAGYKAQTLDPYTGKINQRGLKIYRRKCST